HIKKMMERSSRFVSLSGLSGIGAGICALAGAWLAGRRIDCRINGDCNLERLIYNGGNELANDLLLIAVVTFIAAFASAFLFTWLRSKKQNVALLGGTTARLFWNTAIPIIAGGIFLFRMMQLGIYELVAPGCLIFYGVALVNASKYTLREIRFLGYGTMLLGIINVWFLGYGLLFWVIGFGLLHIIYGVWMWWKYERNNG
ncbi:MAG TPA: hypothetical protein VK498_09965, partial [Ferruginibacter sp.]|nr:hypothetical protein [Ferruginibacter sp.]